MVKITKGERGGDSCWHLASLRPFYSCICLSNRNPLHLFAVFLGSGLSDFVFHPNLLWRFFFPKLVLSKFHRKCSSPLLARIRDSHLIDMYFSTDSMNLMSKLLQFGKAWPALSLFLFFPFSQDMNWKQWFVCATFISADWHDQITWLCILVSEHILETLKLLVEKKAEYWHEHYQKSCISDLSKHCSRTALCIKGVDWSWEEPGRSFLWDLCCCIFRGMRNLLAIVLYLPCFGDSECWFLYVLFFLLHRPLSVVVRYAHNCRRRSYLLGVLSWFQWITFQLQSILCG